MLPLKPEHRRLTDEGLTRLELTKHFFITRLKDPDGKLVVLANAKRAYGSSFGG